MISSIASALIVKSYVSLQAPHNQKVESPRNEILDRETPPEAERVHPPAVRALGITCVIQSSTTSDIAAIIVVIIFL